ncbi:hypothetical protein [Oricola thermophila]|uniref:Curlin associated repeat-containing protein n=1 Tax=Oricola thermophila TaxID=2742145 RepID=A0A6N1VJS7_9HYPH|nr:hypothetical protein [Oricola thermophila]QKV19479.1 hypothetical protein HTY61_13950 [Oricola thermophila]
MRTSILAAIAVLAMGGTAFAGSTVDIDQLGTGNSASALQQGDNNETYVRQLAHYNLSVSKQVGDSNYIVVRQETSYNKVGNADDNSGVVQLGNRNEARVTQKQGNENDVRKLLQNGNRNDARVVQDGSSNVIDRVETHGNDNTVRITQTGSQNGKWGLGSGNLPGGYIDTSDANFALYGGTRKASTLLQYGDGNDAIIGQSGSRNFFEVYQGVSAGNNSVGSDYDLTQVGHYNYAYAMQTGTGHNSTVDQIGNTNRSFVRQDN